MQVLYERCAGLDVHKDQVTAAVRTPGVGPGGRSTQVRKFRRVSCRVLNSTGSEPDATLLQRWEGLESGCRICASLGLCRRECENRNYRRRVHTNNK